MTAQIGQLPAPVLLRRRTAAVLAAHGAVGVLGLTVALASQHAATAYLDLCVFALVGLLAAGSSWPGVVRGSRSGRRALTWSLVVVGAAVGVVAGASIGTVPVAALLLLMVGLQFALALSADSVGREQ